MAGYLSEKQCDFIMTVSNTSHMGGVWEQQSRTVRSVMNYVLSNSALRLDEASMRTFFYEVMSIVNSCPLSMDSITGPKCQDPLAPNHLLTMKTSVLLPPHRNFIATDLYTKSGIHNSATLE